MRGRSALARVLQLSSFATLLFATLAIAHFWPRSPTKAVLLATAICAGGPALLAIQFLGLATFGRKDAIPLPGPAVLFTAWLQESALLYRIFHWRQPFRWRAIDDFTGPDVQGRTGVVLVHGYFCNRGFWNPWMRELQDRGIPFVAPNLEPVYGSINAYAEALEGAVRRLEQATGRPPLLVCHSMGGLAARAWLRAHGTPGRVRHIVTIGTPHAGTWFANLSLSENGAQMRRGNAWLGEMARHESTAASRPPFTCWHSDCDNLVFPVSTATLPHADNRLLHGVPHVALAFQPPVMQHALELAGAAA